MSVSPISTIDLQAILKTVYPIGSIYMSANSTNPSSLLGGTWEAWGSGRVPVGVNAQDDDFNTVEKIGGAKSVILTQANLPGHSHSFTPRVQWSDAQETLNTTSVNNNPVVIADVMGNLGIDRPNARVQNTGTVGEGTGHNNLQPYITCYMWKRTA